ncbi:MAG: hypothetical protein ACEY3L_16175, partial [Wolbachia sp.]
KEDILLKNIIMLIAIIAFGIAYPREMRRAILLITLFLRAVLLDYISLLLMEIYSPIVVQVTLNY